MMLEGISVNNSEGGIISEFYKMEGKDENSREYSCSKIMLNGSRDNVMNFRLLGTLDSHKEEGSSIRVILAGKYRIPTTGIVNFNTTVDENYWFTDYKDIWKINVNENLKILITNYDDYLDVLINTDEDIEYSDVDDICNSLNFVLGIESESVFTNVMNIGHKVQNRRNILKARSFFDAPLTSHHNYGHEFTIIHNRLFNSYYNFIRQDTKKQLPILNHRVVSGGRSYVYTAGLILSVQIETICKDYFFSYYKPDENYINAVNDGIALIAKSDIKRKNDVIGFLKNSISQKKRSNIPVRNILKNLANKNIINKSLIKNWESLRHITAHGDTYGEDEFTPLLKDMFLCTNLYYQMIFYLIKYEGKYSWKEYKINRLELYPVKYTLMSN